MVVSYPRPPLLLPLLLLECDLVLPTTRAESQAPFAPANDSSTAVRHTRPVHRQHSQRYLRFCFARCSCTCCQPVQQRSTICLYYEPTGSYAVCCKSSRRSTGEGNQRVQRGSPQPGYNFDDGNTRFVCRSPRPWSEFGEGNPRSQHRSPQPRHKFGDGGTRFKRRPPQPWHGSLRLTRRAPQPRVAQQ